ncbi:uncharacterized protein LOC117134677 [Drosophila busckii]|uniref:uncharacterized protein LOC117134677 n=1 Tax=Drosophila busckii TaxID=30019 RepID=UPI001432C420|nr:uncharacterized protein LOC117134677 [Drosophila busckii]
MNLPPMLLKRLKSRGLKINTNTQTAISDSIEEIIAENYDEDGQLPSIEHGVSSAKQTPSSEHLWTDRIKERIGVTESYNGFKFCPNTYNIWHTCTIYCVNRWSSGRPKPSEKYIQRYKRLARKYPPGPDWKEAYDYGCGSYYFYNSNTQKVSWLPPSHPKARISSSAATYRRQLANSNDEYDFDPTDIGKTKEVLSNYHDDEPGSSQYNFLPAKKQKVRDLERTLSRKHRI